MVHANRFLEGFLFLVPVNVMTAYLYNTGNKKIVWVLQDIWTGLNNYAKIDHECFHSEPSIIRKVQTLANTKKQRCIQSPVKHLTRSSSGELGPHIRWGYLVFATVSQVKVFSRNITYLTNWIRLTECAIFQMARYTKVKSWATEKTLLLNTH